MKVIIFNESYNIFYNKQERGFCPDIEPRLKASFPKKLVMLVIEV